MTERDRLVQSLSEAVIACNDELAACRHAIPDTPEFDFLAGKTLVECIAALVEKVPYAVALQASMEKLREECRGIFHVSAGWVIGQIDSALAKNPAKNALHVGDDLDTLAEAVEQRNEIFHVYELGGPLYCITFDGSEVPYLWSFDSEQRAKNLCSVLNRVIAPRMQPVHSIGVPIPEGCKEREKAARMSGAFHLIRAMAKLDRAQRSGVAAPDLTAICDAALTEAPK